MNAARTPIPRAGRAPGAPLAVGVTCFPTFGGSGVIATEIGVELARRGHRVHFICSEVPSRLDRFIDDVFFHEVELREYPSFGQSSYPLALASKIVEVSRYERLDLMHVHYAVPHATSAYLARQILREAAPKIVTTLHGTDITLVGHDPSFLPITRLSIMESDGITAPSEYLRRATYQNLDIPETMAIEVIPNFVDTRRFRPAGPEREGQGPAEIGRDAGGRLARPLLVHVSNFRPVKRVDDVARIFALVRAKLPASLALVGDGPERSRVEALVRELGLQREVCFLGKQLNFLEVLQRSDVFLLPSATESFGLAALEALACGVPVVASRIGGLPEVVDAEAGVLVPVGNVAAMAEAVLQILGDPELKARMASAARRLAVERFELGPIVSRYEAYYQKLLR